jgi:nicotinamide mononucleotide transporter
MQTRLSYPVGALSTALLMVLFFQQGLFGSALLNAYLFPTLLYGWFRWKSDDNPKPVSRVKPIWWLGYAAITGAVGIFLMWIAGIYAVPLLALDLTIMILSVLAQFLLDNKKIENWIIWAIGNVIAIYTYAVAGLPLVALQFVFFLANAIYAYFVWRKELNKPVDIIRESNQHIEWDTVTTGVKPGQVLVYAKSQPRNWSEAKFEVGKRPRPDPRYSPAFADAERRRQQEVNDSMLLTAAIIANMEVTRDQSAASVSTESKPEPITGHGGNFGGAGSSGYWDSTPSSSQPDYSSSSSSSSSDSSSSYSSSDSGSSSSDSSSY